jgi:single-stranded DNA-binding protein
MDLNRVNIVGTVQDKIIVRYTAKGDPVCNFTVLTTDGGTAYHRVTAWGYRAEACGKELNEGDVVDIVAGVYYRKGDDGKIWTDIKVASIKRIVGGEEIGAAAADPPPATTPDDDVPF